MFWPHLKLGLQVGLVMVPFGSTAAAATTQAKLEGDDFFEAKIRPVLVEHCYKCHSASAEKVKGDLLLDSREAMLKGGESGKPAIVPSDADRSRLIEAIRYTNDEFQMPPQKAGGKLSDTQISDFIAWVNMGAPDPRTNNRVVAKSPYDFAKARKFWSFQPPTEPPVPKIKNAGWAQSAIDDFILAKLEEKELQPSLPTDKRTLIRRATYDL